MKANHKSLWTRDTRAQVGIGTMIVFIATILVAATAAAVLIDTSGKLSERSSSTGNEATKQVASNLVLKGIYGVRPAATGNLEDLNFTISLAPGASPVDLEQMKIYITNGNKRIELDYQEDHVTANDAFVSTEIRDPKNTHSASAPVLTDGGLVNIEVDLNRADAAAGMTLAERKSIIVLMVPEVGAPLHADFTTPPSYGTDKVVILR